MEQGQKRGRCIGWEAKGKNNENLINYSVLSVLVRFSEDGSDASEASSVEATSNLRFTSLNPKIKVGLKKKPRTN